MKLTFARLGSDETVRFALSELRRLIKQIDSSLFIDERVYTTYDKNVPGVIWVGTVPHEEMPEVKNVLWDDNILIDIRNNEGMITGLNGRSVLFGVYRLLEELGCRWVRPSEDGEVVPHYTLTPLTVHIAEKPDKRFRCICIEGSLAYDHVLAMLDWMPKAKLNSYLFQFKNPYIFFERWYNHLQNPFLPKEGISKDEVYAMYLSLCEEAHKRGIIIVTGGHGFITEPMGLENDGWEHISDDKVPEKVRPYLALRNGKRELWRGMAIATQLCYTDPHVRETVIGDFVNYCETHPEADCVGFSFNDGGDNHCECENCAKWQPSDIYVSYLNEIDRRLTEKNIPTQIMISTYQDNLWAPVQNRIEHLDRFILKLAPMTRDYTDGYADVDVTALPEAKPYVRNHLIRPEKTDEFFSLYKIWRDKYPSLDSATFDYNLWINHRPDFGYIHVAKLIYEDMTHLQNVWLNGMISCQLGRCAYPNNLPMQLMADGLWSAEGTFDGHVRRWCRAAYGEDGDAVKGFFELLSENFDAREYHKGLSEDEKKKALHKIDLAEQGVYDFLPVIEKNLASLPEGAVKASWRYLHFHTELLFLLFPTYRAVVREEKEEKARLAAAVSRFAQHRELQVHRVYEVCQLVNLMDNVVVDNI